MAEISIIVPVFDAGPFLDDAVRCVREQTFRDWELLLFDDGSRDDSLARCRAYAEADPRVRAFSHPGGANKGQFGTRVAAAAKARCELVAMLDQDDIWDVDYLDKQLKRWRALEPEGVQLSYGPGLYWHPSAPEKDYIQPMPAGTPGLFEPPQLLSAFYEGQYAATPLPSTTLIRRDVLRAAGRFAAEARGSQCEDQYLCWFVASRWRVAIQPEAWVKYRQHADSALAKMLAAPAQANAAERRFVETARRELKRLHPDHALLRGGVLDRRIAELAAPSAPSLLGRAMGTVPRLAKLAPRARKGLRILAARSRLAFGLMPLSEAFGEDRGTPLTRLYVEQWLEEQADAVHGDCLEFEGADYTQRYGGDAVTHSDVLHLDESNPLATVVADLTAENDLPSDRYDAIVCTFVLHEILDLEAAVRELHRILQPGGTILIAVPHVTMCEPRYHELWRFTEQGLRELLAEVFEPSHTSIRAFGNSLTAAGQLRGLVAEEFAEEELALSDPRFAVVICARAEKALDAAPATPRSRAPASSRPPLGGLPERSGAPAVRRSAVGSDHAGVVLLYHRIAEPPQDAHLLTVTPGLFDAHLAAIARVAEPLSLLELADCVARGDVPPRAVAVTFDDGYADNLLSAAPALERHRVPGTVFVTSGYIGAEREFWWDSVERIFLETLELPETVTMRLPGSVERFELGDDARWSEADRQRHRRWNVLVEALPTARHRAFMRALEVLKPLPDILRRAALQQLFVQASVDDAPRPSHRAMSVGELRALAASPQVEIGAHTVTHAQLSALPIGDQRYEIAQGRARLEAVLERPVESFAYPFGSQADYTRETVALLREEGFRLAVSNFGGVVRRGCEPLEIPRVMAMRWPVAELESRLERLFEAPTVAR